MKNQLIITGLALLAITSCSKENNPNSNTVGGVTNLMDGGTWRITYFTNDNTDETSNFTDFDFDFGKDEKLTAKGPSTNNGVWSITDSNSSDDDLSELHFNISFLSPQNFEELSDDWEIIEKNKDVVKLKNVSGGGGGTEFLTFTKN